MFFVVSFKSGGGGNIKAVVLNSLMNLVSNYNKDLDEDKLFEIRYGLEGIYLSITKIIVILTASYFLGCLKECLILTILFNILRFPGFGLHASKSWMCWVSSSIVFLGAPLICKYFYFNETISIIICLVCIISFLLYAPADTYKRPLIYKNRRLFYKATTTLISIIYTYFVITTGNHFIHNALICAMIIEVVLIHPLTYKIFKLPYNNYKTYVRSTTEVKEENL